MQKKDNIDIVQLLKDGGVDAVYGVSKGKRALPYAVIRSRGTDNFGADDRMYYKQDHTAIELYSKHKDFELEEKLETILNDAEIFWEKSEDIEIQEGLIEVIYNI